MSRGTVRVLIPLAPAHAWAAPVICSVLGQWVERHDRSLGAQPETVRLRAVGLDKAASRARAAVAQYVPPATGMFRRRVRRSPSLGHCDLKCQNEAEVAALSQPNTRSAELGIALGLLCIAMEAETAEIFATGALADPARAGLSSGDVRIEPVDGLSAKIAGIAAWITATPAETARQFCAVFPATTPDGTPVATTHEAELAALRDAAQQAGHGLKIAFAEHLSDAAHAVGAKRLPVDRRERRARAGLALGALVASALLALAVWSMTPLRLSFVPMDWALGPAFATPAALELNNRTGQRLPRRACIGPDQRPHLAVSMSTYSLSLPIHFSRQRK